MPAGSGSRRYIASDGTPEYVIWAEEALVGAALSVPRSFIPALDPSDFHDAGLATVWRAVLDVPGDPSFFAVMARLIEIDAIDQMGAEPRLAGLMCSEMALLYSNKPAMSAHAAIVAEWGEKRRAIADLGVQARAIQTGRTVIDAAARFLTGRAGEMPNF